MSTIEAFYGSGGRKRATARVFLSPVKSGIGKFIVNKRDLTEYFTELAAVDRVSQPLTVLGLKNVFNQYHIKATVKGGGKSGQRDAIRLALARALLMLDSKKKVDDLEQPVVSEGEDTVLLPWRGQLKKAGLLRRDSRKVERKRYGLHKARKRAPLVKR